MENKKFRFFNFLLIRKLGFFVFCFCAFIFTLCFFRVQAASGATLYFSPSSGNFSVGNILTTSVLVDTQGKAINNSDAIITFPTDLLEVVSISKSGSIFSLWVEEPAFSNSQGTVTYNGGLPTPGYNGSAGKIISIGFRVKNAGAATLVYSSAAVRANDGFGTDILGTRGQAQFNLILEERPTQQPSAVPIPTGTPGAPKISSPTHPNSDRWYANSSATFTWPISGDITATRLLFGKIPVATPSVLYIPPIDQKTTDKLEDGIWYFHAQLKNNAGWGGISHFRFQIDTEKPDRFDIRLVEREDLTDPEVKMIFDAHDKTSGIDHYEVEIDGVSAEDWRDDGSHIYQTPVLKAGKHTLIAKAVDTAGNFLANSIDFSIDSLKAPIITDYPKELTSGEILIIKGETYSQSQVFLWLQKDDQKSESFEIKSDKDGKFTFISEKGLADGTYTAWATVRDSRGAESSPSNEVKIIVSPSAFITIGKFAIGFFAILIPFIVLVIILILIIIYIWYKYLMLKKRLRKQVREAEAALHKSMDLLKESMREQIKTLEKARTRRQLTEEEEQVIKRLRKDLDAAEKIVKKEIEDIEDEVK